MFRSDNNLYVGYKDQPWVYKSDCRVLQEAEIYHRFVPRQKCQDQGSHSKEAGKCAKVPQVVCCRHPLPWLCTSGYLQRRLSLYISLCSQQRDRGLVEVLLDSWGQARTSQRIFWQETFSAGPRSSHPTDPGPEGNINSRLYINQSATTFFF